MFDIFVFSSFLLFFSALAISTIKTKIDNKDLLEKLLTVTIEKSLVINKLESELMKKENSELPEQEGFINFLNQSRDWAFEYIESVQSQIKQFENEVKPLIESFDSNSLVDFELSTKKMIESSRELIKLLPEGDN